MREKSKELIAYMTPPPAEITPEMLDLEEIL